MELKEFLNTKEYLTSGSIETSYRSYDDYFTDEFYFKEIEYRFKKNSTRKGSGIMNFEIEDIVACAMFLQREFSDEILAYTAEQIVEICETVMIGYNSSKNSLDEYLESDNTKEFIERFF